MFGISSYLDVLGQLLSAQVINLMCGSLNDRHSFQMHSKNRPDLCLEIQDCRSQSQ